MAARENYKTVSVYLPTEDFEALRDACYQRRTTKTELIRQALRAYLAKPEKKEK